jgi:thymidylate kinase
MILLILVEGSDCVGKSTLVQQLAEHVAKLHPTDQVDVWHAGPPTKHPLDEYVTPLLDYRPLRGRHIICDRWHLGEAIYPGIFLRPTRFDLAVQAYTELFLRSRGAVLVHVDAEDADVEDCLNARGDELVQSSQASVILQEFRTRAAASLLPTLVVQGLQDTRYDVESIVRRATTLDYVSRDLGRFTTYVGSRIPAVLLLGDVRHGHLRGDATDLRSAFMPYGATSGHYLLSQIIARYGYQSLASVGIANACDDDDHETLWTLLRKPHTVALGRKAQRRTPWANVKTDHPQYRRRFKHSAGDDYAREIFSGISTKSRE